MRSRCCWGVCRGWWWSVRVGAGDSRAFDPLGLWRCFGHPANPCPQVRGTWGTRIVLRCKRANTGVSPLRCAPVEMTVWVGYRRAVASRCPTLSTPALQRAQRVGHPELGSWWEVGVSGHPGPQRRGTWGTRVCAGGGGEPIQGSFPFDCAQNDGGERGGEVKVVRGWVCRW